MKLLLIPLLWVIVSFPLAVFIGRRLRDADDAALEAMLVPCDHCTGLFPIGGPGNIWQHILGEHANSYTAKFLQAELARAKAGRP